MNIALQSSNTLEELFDSFEDYEEKPVIKKMKKEDKHQAKPKRDKGKLRDIKRNYQEEDYE